MVCVFDNFTLRSLRSPMSIDRNKREWVGGEGNCKKTSRSWKLNLCLCRQTECTKNTKRAKELRRVPCDWTKINEEFLGFSSREVARGNQ